MRATGEVGSRFGFARQDVAVSVRVVYACEDCGEEAANYATVCLRCGGLVERVPSDLVASADLIEAIVAEQVDWRGLLKRYIEHVGECEGTDYIDLVPIPTDLTEADLDLLRSLRDEP